MAIDYVKFSPPILILMTQAKNSNYLLTSEFSDQLVLLKIVSSLIAIFCAIMLGDVPCALFTFQSCYGRCCCGTGEGNMFLAQISSISANRILLLSALGL